MDDESQLTAERAGVEFTREELYTAYWSDKKSPSEIGKENGLSATSVRRLLDELNIQRKTSEEAMTHWKEREKQKREYWQESVLRAKYVDEGMSTEEVAEELGVYPSLIRNHLKKHDIPLRRGPYDIPQFALFMRENGSGRYPTLHGCDGQEIPVHQLVVIAHGADPYDVFGNPKMDVDHINRHPADNRPSNVRLVEKAFHGKKEVKLERQMRGKSYSEQDIRFAINWVLGFTGRDTE